MLCAVDTGMVRGMLEGLYGETQPQHRPRAAPTATSTASRASERVAARAYLDHASTSPLRPAALDAMLPYPREHHSAIPGVCTPKAARRGSRSKSAREQVAAFFGARPREVVFTSSGTEAVNTAVRGALARGAAAGTS